MNDAAAIESRAAYQGMVDLLLRRDDPFAFAAELSDAPASRAGRAVRRRLDSLDRHLDEAESLRRDASAYLDSLLDAFRKSAPFSGGPRDFDGVVESMLVRERAIAKSLKQSRSKLLRLAQFVAREAPRLKPEGFRLLARYDEIALGWLRMWRDARWRLMIHQGEIGGKGPVFDDPKEMRRYLVRAIQ